jgi:hypothetical protein
VRYLSSNKGWSRASEQRGVRTGKLFNCHKTGPYLNPGMNESNLNYC